MIKLLITLAVLCVIYLVFFYVLEKYLIWREYCDAFENNNEMGDDDAQRKEKK